MKKVFLNISQNLQKNICVRASIFIKLQDQSIDWFLYEGNTGTKWVNKSYKKMWSGNQCPSVFLKN